MFFQPMNREDSLHMRLSFFLLAGSLAGTVFCNWMDSSMKAELGSMENSLISAVLLREVDFGDLFLTVAFQRETQLAAALLVFMTAAAPALMPLLASGLGFSCSVMMCALTMECGLLGLPRYLLLIFPQCLFYIPVLYLLFVWMPLRQVSLKVPSALALAGLVLLGAAAESFLNPWLLAAFL